MDRWVGGFMDGSMGAMMDGWMEEWVGGLMDG
jgi:hypothetical protein